MEHSQTNNQSVNKYTLYGKGQEVQLTRWSRSHSDNLR